MPPLDEQSEIVRRVETLFTFADRLEVGPQDSADEPAAVLLKRLAQSRPAAAPETRKTRLSQPA